ncbi:uncharacterized protein FTOL_12743 [Fusarium torulosum]|uniref:Uncharacterized protein n=1 Tax=Fusarium torulosum TaxID=33205 RepID=A0AAE8MKV5_9HYPO|nr:uncharacterized protein FTOL_12743 [Fusarium torulosum]
MATVKNTLGDQGLDVLINNAAVTDSTPSAVQNLAVAFLPLLVQVKQKAVLNMSARNPFCTPWESVVHGFDDT